MGCRRNASRSHFGGWGLHRQPQPHAFQLATGVACSELSHHLLKFLNPPSFNSLSSFLHHSSRLAHGCNPLSQNGYVITGPNENSQKASISVYVLAANSQDGVFVRTTKPRPENNKNALVEDAEMNDPWNRRKKRNTMRC